MSELSEEFETDDSKTLTPEERELLSYQNSRIVSEHKANLLELQASKHWDLFYKRNETRFFRDRHWSTREFSELLGENDCKWERVLFEIGCGVGNFIFPLIEENLNLRIFGCDLSPRAIDFVKSNPLYDPTKVNVFQCDITSHEIFDNIENESVDISTLIFVLSAIHPDKYIQTLQNIFRLLKPGGLVLFRDYGLYDMAQLRFKAGNKIADNFYMRQDGTRSYFFSIRSITDVLQKVGFDILVSTYIHKRTVNRKDNIDVPRIFTQVKAKKPLSKECFDYAGSAVT